MQIHVEIEESFYEQAKQAIKALGWATVSEYIRAKIREAIKEAEGRREASEVVGKQALQPTRYESRKR